MERKRHGLRQIEEGKGKKKGTHVTSLMFGLRNTDGVEIDGWMHDRLIERSNAT